MSQVIDTSVVNMKVRELDGVIHGKDIAIAIPFDTPYKIAIFGSVSIISLVTEDRKIAIVAVGSLNFIPGNYTDSLTMGAFKLNIYNVEKALLLQNPKANSAVGVNIPSSGGNSFECCFTCSKRMMDLLKESGVPIDFTQASDSVLATCKVHDIIILFNEYQDAYDFARIENEIVSYVDKKK